MARQTQAVQVRNGRSAWSGIWLRVLGGAVLFGTLGLTSCQALHFSLLGGG